jgi:integrase
MFDKQNPNFKNSSSPNYPIKNNLNNDAYGSSSLGTTSRDGGKRKKCEVLKKDLGRPQHELYTPLFGEDTVDLAYELNKINRQDCPTILDPKSCTFLDVAAHAKLRQRLWITTIQKHLTYARFMETYEAAPVNFRNPSPQNFFRHMDYREEVENATGYALKHEWNAMLMFLRAWGVEKQWPKYRPPPVPQNEDIGVPPPETVHKFFTYKYSDDPYENKLYQYLFYIGFLCGMRPPSELANMDLDNIKIYDNGYGRITLIEDKKHKKRRIINPEKFIMSSPTRKSLSNWINKWRPMVENGNSGNALFLTPQGKRFSVRYLGKKLRQQGKKIWPEFYPYIMRHWCCTARMIEWNFNIDRVRRWAGHKKPDQTMTYLHIAYDRIEQEKDKSSWLKRAIISRPKKSGDESQISATKSKVGKKLDFYLKTLQEARMGPAGSNVTNRRKFFILFTNFVTI